MITEEQMNKVIKRLRWAIAMVIVSIICMVVTLVAILMTARAL